MTTITIPIIWFDGLWVFLGVLAIMVVVWTAKFVLSFLPGYGG